MWFGYADGAGMILEGGRNCSWKEGPGMCVGVSARRCARYVWHGDYEIEMYGMYIWYKRFVWVTYMCLSLPRLLQQIATDWVAYEQQDFIPQSSGGRKSHISEPARAGEGCLLSHRFLIASSRGGKTEGSLWGLL